MYQILFTRAFEVILNVATVPFTKQDCPDHIGNLLHVYVPCVEIIPPGFSALLIASKYGLLNRHAAGPGGARCIINS